MAASLKQAMLYGMEKSDSSRDIPILDCQGSHHEMGWQQGDRFFESIEKISSSLGELLPGSEDPDHKSKLHSLLSKASSPIASSMGKIGKHTTGRDLAKHFPNQFNRLKGIAEGAGVPEHMLYVGQTVERMLNFSVYSKPAAGACTAIAIDGTRFESDEPVIAKNFDYPMVALDSYLVRRSAGDGCAKTMDIGMTMMAGSHEGINEHGLALTYNYGHFKGNGKAAVTITTIVQEVLEQCKNVEEAISAMSKMPRVGGALLMLADANGDIASVELGPDIISVRKSDALIHTNHAITDAMRDRDVPWQATYPKWWPAKDLRKSRYHLSSDLRFQQATARLGNDAGITEAALRSILADHGNGNEGKEAEGNDYSICRHGPYYSTTCSVLFFPKRRSMKVCFGSPCSSHFQEISFSGSNTRGSNTMNTYTGKISKNDLEGGFWQLVAKDGQRYQLKSPDTALQTEGLAVVIEGKIETQSMGIGMSGIILNVKSWKKA